MFPIAFYIVTFYLFYTLHKISGIQRNCIFSFQCITLLPFQKNYVGTWLNLPPVEICMWKTKNQVNEKPWPSTDTAKIYLELETVLPTKCNLSLKSVLSMVYCNWINNHYLTCQRNKSVFKSHFTFKDILRYRDMKQSLKMRSRCSTWILHDKILLKSVLDSHASIFILKIKIREQMTPVFEILCDIQGVTLGLLPASGNRQT